MNLTRWIIAGIVFAVIAIDIALLAIFGDDFTISVTITQWSKQYPVIPFAFGFLMGHFFAQNKGGSNAVS